MVSSSSTPYDLHNSTSLKTLAVILQGGTTSNIHENAEISKTPKLKTLQSKAEFNVDFKSVLIFVIPCILCEI